MCGIYMTNLPYQRMEVEKKIEKIRFRGPDNLSVKKIGDLYEEFHFWLCSSLNRTAEP